MKQLTCDKDQYGPEHELLRDRGRGREPGLHGGPHDGHGHIELQRVRKQDGQCYQGLHHVANTVMNQIIVLLCITYIRSFACILIL